MHEFNRFRNDQNANRVERKTFKITKNSLQEFEIFTKLNAFYTVFPRMYHGAIQTNPFRVHYEFEYMSPMMNPGTGRLDSLVHAEHFEKSFVGALEFTAHTLFALYLLHKDAGIIHSDIAPSNIHYSQLDKIWKLSDFDQSLDIEESKVTKRLVGTEDYIAPEALESQIFTEASDVFSLGQVVFDLIYIPVLLQQFDELEVENVRDSEDSESQEQYRKKNRLKHLFYCFETILMRMTLIDPMMRPTALGALKQIFTIWSDFDPKLDTNFTKTIFINIKNILKLTEFEKKAERRREEAKSAFALLGTDAKEEEYYDA